MPIFTPPVRSERMPTKVKPFSFYNQSISFAVVFRNGHFQDVRVPSQDETAALIEGTTWFSGGRSYLVSDDTAALLTADGYTVS